MGEMAERVATARRRRQLIERERVCVYACVCERGCVREGDRERGCV